MSRRWLVRSALLMLGIAAVVVGCQQEYDALVLVSDATFVYGPTATAIDEADLADSLSASECAVVLEDVSRYYSVNPRVLATLYRLAGDRSVASTDALAEALTEMAGEANAAYYDVLYGVQAESDTPTVFALTDGTTISMASGLNAGTVGVLTVLAVRSDQSAWVERVFGNDPKASFAAAYEQEYGELATVSTNSVVPASLPPDALLSLPWTFGDTWKFSSGPHDYSGTGTGTWSSLDFAPVSGLLYPAYDRWITAPADGVVVSVACGGCQVDIRYANGWGTRFYHVYGCLVSVGQTVTRGQRIGNPSSRPTVGEACGYCGGYATGTHVHQDLMYNGAFYPIEGAALGGWTVHGTTFREGYLEKDGTVKWVNSWVTSEDQSVPATPTATIVPVTPPAAEEGLVALIRYRMPDTNYYYLTSNWNEFESGGYGWVYDDWVGSLSAASQNGANSLLHYYVSGEHRHYYTIEDVVPLDDTWTYGGDVGYIWTTSGAGRVALYAFKNSDSTLYWYGVESSGPDGSGWTSLGILGWIVPAGGVPTVTPTASITSTPTPTWTSAPTRTPTATPLPTSTPTPTPCGQGLSASAEVAYAYSVNTTLDGAPVSAGVCIGASDINGVACGSVLASGSGEWGPMTIRGDNPDTPLDEGPLSGERIYFSVDGHSSGMSIVWTPGTTVMVDLMVKSTTQLVLELDQGWNAVALSVAPGGVVSQPIANVLGTTNSAITRVVDMSTGSARVYYPEMVPAYSDLDTLSAGQAYLIEAVRDTTLTIEGVVLPATTAVKLDTGWQLMPYLGLTDSSPSVVFAGLTDVFDLVRAANGRLYDPRVSVEKNTLTCLEVGSAYWVKATEAMTLAPLGEAGTCPSVGAISASTDTGPVVSGLDWCDLYGDVQINGEIKTSQMIISVFDPDGTLCGSGVAHQDGTWGVLHIRGDDPETSGDEGAEEGDILTIRVNGVLASTSEPVEWTALGLSKLTLRVNAWISLEVPLISR